MKFDAQISLRLCGAGAAMLAVATLAGCGSSSSTPKATDGASTGPKVTVVDAIPSGQSVTKVAFSGPKPSAVTPAEIAAGKASLAHPGTLSVCTALPSPPFEVQDANGKVVGFDMDFMQKVAHDLGTSMKIVDVPFDAISSGQAMLSKRCDIAAAGMTILPERRATIEFSNPYFDTQQALIVTSSTSLTSLQELKGKRVAALSGTTGLDFLNKNSKKYGFAAVQFDSLGAEEQALTSGQVVAAINDLPAWSSYLKENSNTRIAISINNGAQMGWGAAKGNKALIAVANNVLQSAQSDGGYTASYKKWIGDPPPSN